MNYVYVIFDGTSAFIGTKDDSMKEGMQVIDIHFDLDIAQMQADRINENA